MSTSSDLLKLDSVKTENINDIPFRLMPLEVIGFKVNAIVSIAI